MVEDPVCEPVAVAVELVEVVDPGTTLELPEDVPLVDELEALPVVVVDRLVESVLVVDLVVVVGTEVVDGVPGVSGSLVLTRGRIGVQVGKLVVEMVLDEADEEPVVVAELPEVEVVAVVVDSSGAAGVVESCLLTS